MARGGRRGGIAGGADVVCVCCVCGIRGNRGRQPSDEHGQLRARDVGLNSRSEAVNVMHPQCRFRFQVTAKWPVE